MDYFDNVIEIVAMGAGIYAGIKERKEELHDLVLTDTCPFTLGVSVTNYLDRENSVMSPVIERNSILPTSKRGIYTNAFSYQELVTIKVYQGEAYYCRDNLYLGEISMEVEEKSGRKTK